MVPSSEPKIEAEYLTYEQKKIFGVRRYMSDFTRGSKATERSN